ncbi:signal peptidase I [Clostridium cellulovorans]|uniref:Signal peptidase I n=1 Tax=Clostridium cellulovorans (strain ATCC 35296 / DSM 3052 / OCM 3 / 743B) TaxID=573061 RepID=D9SU50_CLOC7|nr:signal peptidase I [Clostridium cellulovorans]ADL50888.1 signal peptidase I [Clostridium cellulovorans 743B]
MENQIQNSVEKSKSKQFLLDWILPITAAIILALLINKYVFFNIKVPTSSMYPTIMEGDRLMVTKVYKPEKLEREDLVVFTIPENKDRLIKRLIGKPGDVVEIAQDGKVSVNGESLDESYVKNPGGIAGRTYTVPEDSYFVLGDNRSNSLDSRYWNQSSFVKGEDIIGKARFTIYPFNRIGGV